MDLVRSFSLVRLTESKKSIVSRDQSLMISWPPHARFSTSATADSSGPKESPCAISVPCAPSHKHRSNEVSSSGQQ
eukprot:2256571-Pyramimonas_sp.AAC.1